MLSVLVACLGLLTFEGFALRLSPEGDVSSASPEKHKVAVMVSGTFARYIVKSSMDRLVAPMVAQGHTVDFFLGLNNGYHWSGSTLEHDPFFAGLDRSSPANFSSGIKDKVAQAVEKAGGHLRSCLLLDNVIVIDKPVFKNYGGAAGPSRSWLKLFKVLDQLWDEVEAEEAASGSKYTHVMIMRDDAYWYTDFNLNKLLKTHGNGVAKDKSWVMAQGCGAGSSYNAKKGEVSDFAFFLSRPAARSFGKIYTAVTAETCRDSVASLNCKHEWKRSEAFFPDYAKKSKISLVKVDVSDIPYQSAWLKQSSNPQEPSVCVRYVCAPSHHSFAKLDDSYDEELGEEGKPKGCLDATKTPSKGNKKKHKPSKFEQKFDGLEIAKDFLMILHNGQFRGEPRPHVFGMIVLVIVFILAVTSALIKYLTNGQQMGHLGQMGFKYMLGIRWMVCSWLIILFNKWLFSSDNGIGFSFPVLLVVCQMAFATIFTRIAWLLAPSMFATNITSNTIEQQPFHMISWYEWATGVLPVAVCMAVSLSSSQFGLKLNTVQLVQAVKMSDCCVVYLFAILLSRDRFTWRKTCAVLIPVIGVLCFVQGEIRFNSFSLAGLLFQLIALMADGCRVPLIDHLMACRNVRLNPMSSLYLLAPIICVMLSLFAEWSEARQWLSMQDNSWVFAIILANAVVATMLNMTLFSFLQCAGCTFVSLMGCFKDLLLVFIGSIVFDNQISFIHYVAMGAILLGIAIYDNAQEADKAKPSNTN